jgi:hypothetical protein
VKHSLAILLWPNPMASVVAMGLGYEVKPKLGYLLLTEGKYDVQSYLE